MACICASRAGLASSEVMAEYELRPIRADETEAYARAVGEAFQFDPRDDELAL